MGGEVQVRVNPSASMFWELLRDEEDAGDGDSAADIVVQGWIRDRLVSKMSKFPVDFIAQ